MLVFILAFFTGCGSSNVQDSTSPEPTKTAADTVSNVLNTELFTEENATKINLDEKKEGFTISAPGEYILKGKFEGQITVSVAKEAKVKLVLDSADITSHNCAAIYVSSADKVIISSKEGTTNTIVSDGKFPSDEKKDAAVFSKDDLTFNGNGIINIKSPKHGVVTKDDLKLNGGTVIIESEKKGFEGKESIEVNDGSYTVKSGNECLESEGDISVTGGTLLLSSQKKDAVKSKTNYLVSDGTVTVYNSKEGIEAQTVTISGGTTTISATDDGINASSPNNAGEVASLKNGPEKQADANAFVKIDGGSLLITAGGDGIDSNGKITISGGHTFVSTPNGNSENAIDYASELVIDGGTVFACGEKSDSKNVSDNSKQPSILYNFETEYVSGTKVIILDSDEKMLESYESAYGFTALLFSSSKLTEGNTYKLLVGNDTYDVKLEGKCFNNGAE